MVEELEIKKSILCDEEDRFTSKFIREAALECVVDMNMRMGINMSDAQRQECEYKIALMLADAVEYGKNII